MGPRVLCCWEWGMVQSLRRTVWQVLRKLNMLPYEPAIALLRDLLRRKKKLISKKKKILHTNAQDSFTHASPKLKTAKIFQWFMGIQTGLSVSCHAPQY